MACQEGLQCGVLLVQMGCVPMAENARGWRLLLIAIAIDGVCPHDLEPSSNCHSSM